MDRPIATCEPSLPMPDGGYVRTFESQIDDHSASAIRVRGVQSDHRCALEHEWVLQTPEYEVLEASARHLRGEPSVLAPELVTHYQNSKGARIARGFTKTVREALGDLPGRQEHVALAIEMARVGQQAYKLPKEYHERFRPLVASMAPGPSREARINWEQDRSYMPALCNSCYTYRDDSVSLFEERTVVSFDPQLVSPDPGQKRIFWRKKRMHISKSRDGSGFHCKNEMNDTIHDIKIEFDITPDGTVKQAVGRGSSFPYLGICEDALLRTLGLNGRKLGKDFVRVIADQVGGSTGCTHLFDLSVDCLRFFNWR